MAKAKKRPNPTDDATDAAAKAKYTGPRIDAGTLVRNGAFDGNQAIADSLYLQGNLGARGLQQVVKGDEVDRAVVLNVSTNAVANSWGGWYYDENAHPPTPAVRTAVAVYTAWAAANLHHGKR